MAEKNTISILESIKKKMHNFEKPRKPENSGFAAVGDEFDYISSGKKDAGDAEKNPQENKVAAAAKKDTTSNQTSEVLEKEMDETFSSFLSKNVEEKSEKAATSSEIVPPPAASKTEDAHDPQDDFLSSFINEDDASKPEEAMVAPELHQEEVTPSLVQEAAPAALPSNHDEDAAFDFLDDHNLDEHVEQKHDEQPSSPALQHHDELHELNQNLTKAPAVEAFAHIEDDHHDFSFLHDDDLHEELSVSAAQLGKMPTKPEESVGNENVMENFLESDAPTVEFADKMHISPEAQAPSVKQMPQFTAPQRGFSSSIPSQFQPMQPQEAKQTPLPAQFQPDPIAPTANKIRDDFDEEAFLKADENKLRKEYETNKIIEPKIDFNRNAAENIMQNRGNQVMSAADSLLKGEAFDQTSNSLKKLLEAKNAVSTVASFSKSDNLNEMALQLLEPRLEKWINENLPALVEKIVREEINKVMPK